MTVRECLERPGIIRQAIMLKLTRIETLRKYAVPSSCGLDPVRVKATLDPARMQALLADAADEEKEVTRLKEELSQAAFEAAILISKLPDVTMIRLLELRYLECLSWPETVLTLDCSPSVAYRLHRKALDFLQPVPASRGKGK